MYAIKDDEGTLIAKTFSEWDFADLCEVYQQELDAEIYEIDSDYPQTAEDVIAWIKDHDSTFINVNSKQKYQFTKRGDATEISVGELCLRVPTKKIQPFFEREITASGVTITAVDEWELVED